MRFHVRLELSCLVSCLASCLVFCLGLTVPSMTQARTEIMSVLSDSDQVSTARMSFSADDPQMVISATTSDLKSVFQRYKPVLEQGSRIVSPPVITGPAGSPHLEMAIEKCVLFVCKTVYMRTDLSIHDVHGPCNRNMILNADLKKSDDLLSSVYDALNVNICVQNDALRPTDVSLDMQAFAHHADSYSSGPIQAQDYQVLQLQTPAMIEALKQALIANGANVQFREILFW